MFKNVRATKSLVLILHKHLGESKLLGQNPMPVDISTLL